MPRVRRRLPARRHEELSEIAREKLESGHTFDFLGGEALDMEGLREVWQDHKETILASYIPPSWNEDQPCWGEYCFDLVPRFGPRRGVDDDDTDFGFFISETDAEPWADYFRRCKVAR